jgi:DNA polymerase-3 subunit epsilon
VAPSAPANPSLADIAFCIVDLETTGGSADRDSITEIGAVKVCRGEVLGTFHTLVEPGTPIPAFIRLLTGISEATLAGAPPIDAVLPSLLEFVRGTVIVAHNARFDVSFLNCALERAGYDRLGNRVVDTAALARKLLAGETSDRRLDTLARHLRCAHLPCHRAFADALATVDVLHALIERAGSYGAVTLADLESLSTARIDNTFAKIRMTDSLPRLPGVYRFIGGGSRTLYVGKATDLRSRVRSYFYGDPRRRVRDLLRETQSIEAEVHPTTLEAEAAEARAIARESPPFNRSGKQKAAWYVKISLRGASPKVSTTRRPRDDGAVYLGPVPPRAAKALVLALQEALPIHRCSAPERCRGCIFSDMGTCSGTDRRAQRAHVAAAAEAVAADPGAVLQGLAARMELLARRCSFERAAQVRERARLLQRAIGRAARIRALVAAGDVFLRVGARAVLVRDAQLAAACDVGPGDDARERARRLTTEASWVPVGTWLPPEVAPEARAVSSWLARHAGDVGLLWVEGSWAQPAGLGPPTRFASGG